MSNLSLFIHLKLEPDPEGRVEFEFIAEFDFSFKCIYHVSLLE